MEFYVLRKCQWLGMVMVVIMIRSYHCRELTLWQTQHWIYYVTWLIYSLHSTVCDDNNNPEVWLSTYCTRTCANHYSFNSQYNCCVYIIFSFNSYDNPRNIIIRISQWEKKTQKIQVIHPLFNSTLKLYKRFGYVQYVLEIVPILARSLIASIFKIKCFHSRNLKIIFEKLLNSNNNFFKQLYRQRI